MWKKSVVLLLHIMLTIMDDCKKDSIVPGRQYVYPTENDAFEMPLSEFFSEEYIEFQQDNNDFHIQNRITKLSETQINQQSISIAFQTFAGSQNILTNSSIIFTTDYQLYQISLDENGQLETKEFGTPLQLLNQKNCYDAKPFPSPDTTINEVIITCTSLDNNQHSITPIIIYVHQDNIYTQTLEIQLSQGELYGVKTQIIYYSPENRTFFSFMFIFNNGENSRNGTLYLYEMVTSNQMRYFLNFTSNAVDFFIGQDLTVFLLNRDQGVEVYKYQQQQNSFYYYRTIFLKINPPYFSLGVLSEGNVAVQQDYWIVVSSKYQIQTIFYTLFQEQKQGKIYDLTILIRRSYDIGIMPSLQIGYDYIIYTCDSWEILLPGILSNHNKPLAFNYQFSTISFNPTYNYIFQSFPSQLAAYTIQTPRLFFHLTNQYSYGNILLTGQTLEYVECSTLVTYQLVSFLDKAIKIIVDNVGTYLPTQIVHYFSTRFPISRLFEGQFIQYQLDYQQYSINDPIIQLETVNAIDQKIFETIIFVKNLQFQDDVYQYFQFSNFTLLIEKYSPYTGEKTKNYINFSDQIIYIDYGKRSQITSNIISKILGLVFRNSPTKIFFYNFESLTNYDQITIDATEQIIKFKIIADLLFILTSSKKVLIYSFSNKIELLNLRFYNIYDIETNFNNYGSTLVLVDNSKFWFLKCAFYNNKLACFNTMTQNLPQNFFSQAQIRLGLTRYGVYIAVSESDTSLTLFYSKWSEYKSYIQALFMISFPIVCDSSDTHFYVLNENKNGVMVFQSTSTANSILFHVFTISTQFVSVVSLENYYDLISMIQNNKLQEFQLFHQSTLTLKPNGLQETIYSTSLTDAYRLKIINADTSEKLLFPESFSVYDTKINLQFKSNIIQVQKNNYFSFKPFDMINGSVTNFRVYCDDCGQININNSFNQLPQPSYGSLNPGIFVFAKGTSEKLYYFQSEFQDLYYFDVKKNQIIKVNNKQLQIFINCPVLLSFDDGQSLISICNLFNTGCQYTFYNQTNTFVHDIDQCISIEKGWTQNNIILLSGIFNSNQNMGIYYYENALLNQISILSDLKPKEQIISESSFFLSDSIQTNQNSTFIAGKIFLLNQYAQITYYSQLLNNGKLLSQVSIFQWEIRQIIAGSSDQSVQLQQLLQISYPLLISENSKQSLNFLLTSEQVIHYIIQLDIDWTPLILQTSLKPIYNNGRIYDLLPGLGIAKTLPLAQITKDFLIIPYIIGTSITIAGYLNYGNQPPTIFGGITIPGSIEIFNLFAFYQASNKSFAVFIDSNGYPQNMEIQNLVTISSEYDADETIELFGSNPYSYNEQNISISIPSTSKSVSQTIGWVFLSLILTFIFFSAIYLGYKAHQRNRLARQFQLQEQYRNMP